MNTSNRLRTCISVFLLSLCLPAAALAERDYSRLVVFGDSLSDPGNAFVFTGMALTPPYTSGVPDYPYARGGHHLSNGSTWIEQLATRMNLGNSVGPALRVPGTFSNYAIDRTRACADSLFPSHINLSEQVGDFLERFGPIVPDDALYVIFVGSNDVRDALITLLSTGDQESADDLVECALNSIFENIHALIGAGAQTFLVANVPNLGLIPALATLPEPVPEWASGYSDAFNDQLDDILDYFEYNENVLFYRLDTYQLVTTVIEAAQAGYLDLNVEDPCIDIISGKACARAKDYLFWDHIHPTKTGHGFLAEGASEELDLE